MRSQGEYTEEREREAGRGPSAQRLHACLSLATTLVSSSSRLSCARMRALVAALTFLQCEGHA
eukprot:6064216-Pleurochrysis_carterae.AAC.3